MSASVEANTAGWRKRSREDEGPTQMDLKRPRYYYYRLESESSKASEEDTESVCSLQDRETDVVRDTTDTDSKSDCSEYEVHYEEYEVASLSESENDFVGLSSSDSEDMMLAAAAVAICDSSLETWITDCEDSDNTSLDESSFGKTDFSICIQCKSENDNPLYRYCEKCFQDRKKFYPPRPKRSRKSRNTTKKKPVLPVKLDTLRSCLSGLSQDSGIGSSQECPSFDLDQIVVPEHLTPGTSQISTIPETNENVEEAYGKKVCPEDITSSSKNSITVSSDEIGTTVQDVKTSESTSSNIDTDSKSKQGRKRYLSESSLSDFEAQASKRAKTESLDGPLSEKQLSLSQTSDLGSEVSSTSFISTFVEKSSSEIDGLKSGTSDSSELCIFCNDAPKDAIFLHAKVAHQCCCYKCAKRVLKTIKRCPICSCTVNKVIKVIKS